MKKINITLNWASRAMRGLILPAAVTLGSLVAARGDPTQSTSVKPYVLKKCAVDGKKLSKAHNPSTLSQEGREVKLCSQKCVPKFQKHTTKYLGKIMRAEERIAKAKTYSSLPPALDNQPGGLAWPGW